VYFNTRSQLAARILIHAANWPRVLKYTRPIVQLVSTGPTACIYVATCTRPTVRHVYSDRTRGEKQFFFVVHPCGATFSIFKANVRHLPYPTRLDELDWMSACEIK